MARRHFKLKAIYSSDGEYVRNAHINYIKDCVQRDKPIVAEIMARVEIKPKYFVKYFGTLIEITESQALTLSAELVIKK